MANSEHKIMRLDDRALVAIFEKALKAAEAAQNEDGLSGDRVSVKARYQDTTVLKLWEFQASSAESGKYIISSATLSLTDERAQTGSVAFHVIRGTDGQLDRFLISDLPNGGNRSVWTSGRGKAALTAASNIMSDLLAPASGDLDSAFGQLSNFAANIDSSFRSFTQGMEQTLQNLAEQRDRDQQHADATKVELRKEIEEERQRVLDAARKEIDVKNKLLDDRELTLDARENELEIKSHKDARRTAFLDMQTTLLDGKNKPTSMFSVGISRWLIFGTLCGGGILAARFALSSMTVDVLPETATPFQIWTVILKPIGLSALALGSFGAAVQWLRHFHTHDLRNAVETQRFGYDMARASWVMEAYLEMTQEHGIQDVPDSWMSNATEGLFQGDRGNYAMDEASQALAALLGMSASVKAGPNGIETTLGKKALKKISTAADND